MRLLIALVICLTFILTGCGSSGGGNGTGGSGGSNSVFVPGKWTMTVAGPAGFNLIEFDMNFTQSGNTISSDSDDTVDNSSPCGGVHVDSSTGTVSGDQFHLLLTVNSETITMNGTLSPDGKSVGIESGHFTSKSGGPCFNGVEGGFSANFIPPFTGSFTGTLQVIPVLGAPAVTAMFTQDANFNLSGSLMVANDPCFSSLATSASKPGMSIGSLSLFEMTDGVNVLDFTGRTLTGGAIIGLEFDASFTVVAGCTEEINGELTLEPTGSAAVAMASTPESPALAINPALLQRLRAISASRSARERLREP
jgi:hypothetical protein